MTTASTSAPAIRSHQPKPAELVLPASVRLAPGVVPPTGYVRTPDGRAHDVAGFCRDIVGGMVRGALAGTHDTQMQQAVAAAAFAELAAIVAPTIGPWVRAACFPDDAFDEVDDVGALATWERADAHGRVRVVVMPDAAEPQQSAPHPEPHWVLVDVSIAGCFDYDGRTYSCMQAAGRAVYIEPMRMGDSRGVHVWRAEVDEVTQEARLIGSAWPMPPLCGGQSNEWEHA